MDAIMKQDDMDKTRKELLSPMAIELKSNLQDKIEKMKAKQQ